MGKLFSHDVRFRTGSEEASYELVKLLTANATKVSGRMIEITRKQLSLDAASPAQDLYSASITEGGVYTAQHLIG